MQYEMLGVHFKFIKITATVYINETSCKRELNKVALLVTRGMNSGLNVYFFLKCNSKIKLNTQS